MIAAGIYHGSLNIESNSEDLIDSAQLLPYPVLTLPAGRDADQLPISLSLTEFHFILLYKDRIVGVCNLDDKLTYEELLPIVSFVPRIWNEGT